MECWVKRIFEANRSHCDFLLAHYSIIPTFLFAARCLLLAVFRPAPLAVLGLVGDRQ